MLHLIKPVCLTEAVPIPRRWAILLTLLVSIATLPARTAAQDDFEDPTDARLPRLLSFVTLSGSYALQYGGSTDVAFVDGDVFREGSADFGDLYGSSAGIGLTIGSFVDGDFGLYVGVRYTKLQLKSTADIRINGDEDVTVALVGEGLKLHDLEFGIILPLSDPRVTAHTPILSAAVALSSPETLFDQTDRIAHIKLSGGALIRIAALSSHGSQISIYPNVTYDFGHEGDIPSMGSVGMGLQFSWAGRGN